MSYYNLDIIICQLHTWWVKGLDVFWCRKKEISGPRGTDFAHLEKLVTAGCSQGTQGIYHANMSLIAGNFWKFESHDTYTIYTLRLPQAALPSTSFLVSAIIRFNSCAGPSLWDGQETRSVIHAKLLSNPLHESSWYTHWIAYICVYLYVCMHVCLHACM